MVRQRLIDMQDEIKQQEVKSSKVLENLTNVGNSVDNVDNSSDPLICLASMAETYYDVSQQINPLEEQKKDLSTKIKCLMKSNNLSSYDTSKVNVTIREIVKSGFVEELLLDTIKKLGVPDIIKTREYVDMQALETALYKGEINGTELVDCQTETVTQALYVKKVKKHIN